MNKWCIIFYMWHQCSWRVSDMSLWGIEICCLCCGCSSTDSMVICNWFVVDVVKCGSCWLIYFVWDTRISFAYTWEGCIYCFGVLGDSTVWSTSNAFVWCPNGWRVNRIMRLVVGDGWRMIFYMSRRCCMDCVCGEICLGSWENACICDGNQCTTS